MHLRRLPSLVLSLVLLGTFNALPAQAKQDVQHLTCTNDDQGLMCTIKETQETISLQRSTPSQSQQPQHSEQLEQFSDGLLGLIYIGLPIALVVVITLHHKRDLQRTKRLEQLERIWQQS